MVSGKSIFMYVLLERYLFVERLWDMPGLRVSGQCIY